MEDSFIYYASFATGKHGGTMLSGTVFVYQWRDDNNENNWPDWLVKSDRKILEGIQYGEWIVAVLPERLMTKMPKELYHRLFQPTDGDLGGDITCEHEYRKMEAVPNPCRDMPSGCFKMYNRCIHSVSVCSKCGHVRCFGSHGQISLIPDTCKKAAYSIRQHFEIIPKNVRELKKDIELMYAVRKYYLLEHTIKKFLQGREEPDQILKQALEEVKKIDAMRYRSINQIDKESHEKLMEAEKKYQ